jgi:hypothetical protein
VELEYLTSEIKTRLVYYESIKRELKIKPIYERRCDERLQTKTKRTPEDKDEVNKREVCECEG